MTEGQPRSVVPFGGGDCLYVNVTDAAKRIHGIERQDNARVHITTRGVFIEPLGRD
jgi:hypothetical protein